MNESIAPRHLDVERSAVPIERLPRCRGEHIFREADKASARPRIFTGTLMVIMPVCHSATSASMRNDRIIAPCLGRLWRHVDSRGLLAGQ